MWPLGNIREHYSERKKQVLECISDLEHRLQAKGVETGGLFDNQAYAQVLTYGWTVGIFTGIDRNVLCLIRKFQQRWNDPNPEIELTHEVQRRPSGSHVGNLPNKDYEQQLQEYNRQMLQIEEQRSKLLDTEDGRTYTYVQHQKEGDSCIACAGTGLTITSLELPADSCTVCNGYGRVYQDLPVAYEQQRVYDSVCRQLAAFERNHPTYPQRLFQVYARIK
jgi:hypothetical protein